METANGFLLLNGTIRPQTFTRGGPKVAFNKLLGRANEDEREEEENAVKKKGMKCEWIHMLGR